MTKLLLRTWLSRTMLTMALLLSVGLSDGVGGEGLSAPHKALSLWYTQPAEKWTEALPVGNGRLGAMVFGKVQEERIQLNEDTVWAGGPHRYARTGAAQYLPRIRQLLFDGKQREAERLAGEHFMSEPLRQVPYQPLGNLLLSLPSDGQVSHYRRDLDIDSAVASVSYQVGDTTFRREVIASAPDQVVAVRITADQPGKVSFTATLDSPHPGTKTMASGDGQLTMRGIVPPLQYVQGERSVQFESRLAVVAQGGEVTASQDKVHVKGADSVTLLVVAATNYVNFRDLSGNRSSRCDKVARALKGKTYETIRQAHVADYQQLFHRVRLDVGTTDKAQRPTDVRLKTFEDGGDPQLAVLYLQYARYLMISGSRPGSQPRTCKAFGTIAPNHPGIQSTRPTSTAK